MKPPNISRIPSQPVRVFVGQELLNFRRGGWAWYTVDVFYIRDDARARLARYFEASQQWTKPLKRWQLRVKTMVAQERAA